MFKRIIIILVFVNCTIFSCSKDDNSNENSVSGNKQTTGASSKDILSDVKYKSILLEIAYVEGFEPTQAAIDNFVSFLEARTFKPDGITIQTHPITSTSMETFTVQEIAAIEDSNRIFYNSGTEIAIWLFFTDGKASTDTNTLATLGTAYRNTSFVIFEDTVRRFSDSPQEPNRSVLETTVITHEFGHILGLTNLGAPLQSMHEDSEHPKHCDVEDCLMYFSSESGVGVTNMLQNGTAPTLDAECIADLQANGGR